jgi:uncharacterized protein (TIGR02145 family)
MVQYLNGATNSISWNPVPTGNVQGICPAGWHLPTDAEWTILTNFLGGESCAGGLMKEGGTTHWASPNTSATNLTGFTALPGGGRYLNGAFINFTNNGFFGSASESFASSAWVRYLFSDNAGISSYNENKLYGFSVRCLKN